VERATGQLQIASNSTIVEFNPWEMGSYDSELAAFAPLKYVGSDFENGTIRRNRDCVLGVDNAGFVMGTSASLFNPAFLQIDEAQNVPDFLLKAINNTLVDIGDENRDIANWPNPFTNTILVTTRTRTARSLPLSTAVRTCKTFPPIHCSCLTEKSMLYSQLMALLIERLAGQMARLLSQRTRGLSSALRHK